MGKVNGLRNTVELNLLLPCFGLSAMYLPTPDTARRHHFTAVLISCPYTIYMYGQSYLVQFSKNMRCPLPLFLSRKVIYLWLSVVVAWLGGVALPHSKH